MAFIYTRSVLKTRVNANIQGRIGMLVDEDETINAAVREVFGKVHLRSARRRAQLTPNLFQDVHDYGAPSDILGTRLIDIPAQAKRSDGQFALVTTEEFARQKKLGTIAIDDYNGSKILKIASRVDSKLVIVSELDSLTSGGGTWALFGDGESVAVDSDDFIKGAGSIKFAISSAGGTTAGIQNSSLNSFDLTDYLGGNGALFVFHKINSATNITNYILRIGTDTSNYYSKTITAAHDGSAFAAGWQLLRFDLTSLTETGSVTDADINYIALYMTKAAGKVSETDYKFDYIALMKGEIHYVKYYTKYGWQSSAGAYKENSTDDSDLLVADTDEVALIEKSATAKAKYEIGERTESEALQAELKGDIKTYQKENPSEAKVMTNEYYSYGPETNFVSTD